MSCRREGIPIVGEIAEGQSFRMREQEETLGAALALRADYERFTGGPTAPRF